MGSSCSCKESDTTSDWGLNWKELKVSDNLLQHIRKPEHALTHDAFAPSTTSNTKFPEWPFSWGNPHKGWFTPCWVPFLCFQVFLVQVSAPRSLDFMKIPWHWNVRSLLSVYPMLPWPVPFPSDSSFSDNSSNETSTEAKYVPGIVPLRHMVTLDLRSTPEPDCQGWNHSATY